MSAKSYAVLGSPIIHSLSPVIHRVILNHLGLQDSYVSIETNDLESFLSSSSTFNGLSLTMPLKEQALSCSDYVEPVAQLVGSVNTLHNDNGRWLGYNTDIYGLRKAVAGLHFRTVSVLGTGATARSALQAFQGSDLSLWGRDQAKVDVLARKFECESSDLNAALASDLVISTLPAGALMELITEESSYPGVLLDVAYANKVTGAELGFANSISGLEMLLWQAIAQQRIFNGPGIQTELVDEAKLADDIRAALDMAK